jgi:predicted nuclease of predicted toxin-antitoxin system
MAAAADADARIVITKGRDLRDGHLLRGSPARLLVVSTGNISNDDLLTRFDENLQTIIDAFSTTEFASRSLDGRWIRPCRVRRRNERHDRACSKPGSSP